MSRKRPTGAYPSDVTPTDPRRHQTTEVKDGCPSDCGLCPEHKQHACLGIIEVNTDCNLDRPICFADSGHQPDSYSITLEQCERMLDVFVESEGEPEVVMFSGGEPTIHKHILDFVDAAQARPICREGASPARKQIAPCVAQSLETTAPLGLSGLSRQQTTEGRSVG